jgi:hypothetical protein
LSRQDHGKQRLAFTADGSVAHALVLPANEPEVGFPAVEGEAKK